MNGIRELLESKAGKAVGVALAVVAVGLMVWILVGQFGASTATAYSRDRTYIDATTGESFEHTLQAGDKNPIDAPSGGKTGYPAEWCYWTADGKMKQEPTAVLLETYKGNAGPTFCPDCGRLVVIHNPGAMPGLEPPPTKAEFEASRSGRPNNASSGGQQDDPR